MSAIKIKNREDFLRSYLTRASWNAFFAGTALALAHFAGDDRMIDIGDGIALKHALYATATALYVRGWTVYTACRSGLTRLENIARLHQGAFNHTKRGFMFLTAGIAPFCGWQLGASIGNELMPLAYHNQDNVRIVFGALSVLGTAFCAMWIAAGRQSLSVYLIRDQEIAWGEETLLQDRGIGALTGNPIRSLLGRNRSGDKKPKPRP